MKQYGTYIGEDVRLKGKVAALLPSTGFPGPWVMGQFNDPLLGKEFTQEWKPYREECFFIKDTIKETL